MSPQPEGVAAAPGSLGARAEFLLLRRADGFRCLADIVVATPGRLVDHIDQTPGFSLQQLRFLVGCPPTQRGLGLGRVPTSATGQTPGLLLPQVIDEADRMMDSMHQSWLPRVVAAAFPNDGTKGPFALFQRRQLQAVTAARYLVPSSALGGVPRAQQLLVWA